jgi:hypothetical protein
MSKGEDKFGKPPFGKIYQDMDYVFPSYKWTISCNIITQY